MDKNKIIQAATKYVQRGHYGKAIAEYQKILKKDPKDVRTLLKLGEAQQKKGDIQDAAKTLFEVAQSYAGDGFYLKAVAVYKQVLKLTPENLEVNLRLAEQYQQLGLLSDALSQLQIVATQQKRLGEVDEALQTLQQMIELEPEGVAPRLEKAELLNQNGKKKEALEELEEVARLLEEARRTDDYIRVAERILSLRGKDPKLARKLAELYLSRGDPKRALAKLQVCYEAEPRNLEILELLAKTFVEAGRVPKAVSAYKEMAKVLQQQGKSDEEARIWAEVRRLAPEDVEAASAVGARSSAGPSPTPSPPPSPPVTERSVAKQIIASGPGPVPTPPPADVPGPIGKLLNEIDVYLKYRLFDKARGHLHKIFEIDPDSLEGRERACAVYAALEDVPALKKELMELVRLHRRRNDPVQAAQALARLRDVAPGDPEVDALAAEAAPPPTVRDATSATFNPFDDSSDLALSHATIVGDEDDVIVDEPLLGLLGFQELPAENVTEGGIDWDAHAPSSTPSASPAAVIPPPSDSQPTVPVQQVVAPPPPPAAQAAPPPPPPPAAQAVVPPPPPTPAPQAPPARPTPPPLAAPPPQAPRAPAPQAAPPAEIPAELEAYLEEVDFFLQQGMTEEAAELLLSLATKYPGHPAVAQRLQQTTVATGAVAAPPPAAAAAPVAPAPVAPPPTAAVQAPVVAEAPPAAAPAKSAAVAAASPEPANVASRPEVSFGRAMPLPEAPSGGDIFDPESLLSLVGGEEGEPQANAGSGQIGAEEVLESFKKGIAMTVPEEDSETHFNLGQAYRSMNLLPEAIDSFELVTRAAAGKEREVDAWTMIGLCHADLGKHAEAIGAYERGLASPAVTEEAKKALHFEIARSFEAQGRQKEALLHYGKVAGMDQGYRDVGRAIERLMGAEG